MPWTKNPLMSVNLPNHIKQVSKNCRNGNRSSCYPDGCIFFDRNRIVAIDGTLFEKYTEYSYYIEIILHFLFKERVKKIKLEFARG